MKFIEMTLQVTESNFPKPIKIFKMTPQENGQPPLTGNKQPKTWSNSFLSETKLLN